MDAIAHLIIILGNPFTYKIGRLILSVLSIGKLSIQPLPTKFPANFVQAFDEDKVVENQEKQSHSISYGITISIGYVVIVAILGALLFYNIDGLIEA
ncbi:hypothetical protein PVK64_19735 [Aliivibrio sp. S4TY2]|uniref:hypothetical protein n=1 Tax=unclassified Aliivibrio TaxID=2645654 RepID=UPI002378B118|nr:MULTISPECIES: hypothetical protein [unclassified Aliivibrio]MDD9158400.1 hypothetical protein [Aliivibrio sp. S4TY2]MDD9162400.1 hypothetical protein [Aliivibrio sp. S4TY1]MDD9166407.1 hypothetical protein [Aliivibrio sp. S4MY2]MDD9170405.1 hypothetical protein [Aliivibrio sp. S4MY4]MDD9187485.1 hypothetical protein [Aliivibrio sp. S4MY3]